MAPILDYANIKHLGDQLLYVVTTVVYLIPDIPHPIMIFFGPQGSGKTWSLRAVRLIIDPSLLDLLSLPRRYKELVQNLDHHWCAFYDNVGRLPAWISNVFCRAVTGTGVSKRALYTNDDDFVYNYRRNLGLTDINIAAERGDLLERGLLLGLSAIPKDKRKTEKELRSTLENFHPKILGGILDVLVKALNLYTEAKPGTLFRMADYTTWGCAITKAIGIDPKHFLESYEENVMFQNLEAARASPISDALIELIKSYPLGWSGTPSKLYSELEENAKELKISTRQKAWPKQPWILSRRLNELAPALPSIGLKIERERTGKARLIHINTVKSVTRKNDWERGKDLREYLDGNGDTYDANDTISESLTGDLLDQPPRMMSTGDLLPFLQEEWNTGYEVDFIDLTVEKGIWTEKEAKHLFNQLVKEGQILRDPEGYWRWV